MQEFWPRHFLVQTPCPYCPKQAPSSLVSLISLRVQSALLYLVHVMSVRPENGSVWSTVYLWHLTQFLAHGRQDILVELNKYIPGPVGVSRRNQSC